MNNVTFIIKTLERPYCLLRLVKSIFRYYPDANILIGDDSVKSCKEAVARRWPNNNISVFELPHDCGISYGRNYLVNKVTTEYFVLLDDDFEFDERTDIKKGMEVFNNHNLDVGGGVF